MKYGKKIFALLIVAVCLCTCVMPAYAADVVVSKSTTNYGTLKGTLYDSSAFLNGNFLFYEFGFETTVTRLPSTAALVLADIELYNTQTGSFIGEDHATNEYSTNPKEASYYYQLDHVSNIRGQNGITVTTFGCHEARYEDSAVVYTKKTYNLKRDHGIV